MNLTNFKWDQDADGIVTLTWDVPGRTMNVLTGSAVAARTAATRTPLLSNSFLRVKHVSLFEAVRLGMAAEEDRSLDQMPIQKIMSVPVTRPGGEVMGVVQVSRKGLDAPSAGADFSGEDLKLLEQAAEVIARMPFMQEGAEL